jgi:hypothetical protein
MAEPWLNGTDSDHSPLWRENEAPPEKASPSPYPPLDTSDVFI